MANQFNQQSQQYGSQYDAARNSANEANQNLQSYNQSMQDPSQLYSQALTGAQQMYGFNPQDLLKANQAMANTNTTIANLPQATQQQGNYYGATAGAEANNYQQQAGNLQGVLAGQANTAGAFQNVLGATQNQANQQATLGYQGEQLKSQNLEDLYNNSLQQQQAAGSQMQYFANLYQQQGGLSAQQAASYAAAQASYASASQAAAQARQLNQQSDMASQVQQQLQQLYGSSGKNYTQALMSQLTGQNVNLPSTGSPSSAPKTSTPQKTTSTPQSSGGFNLGGSTTGTGALFRGF